MRISKMKLIFLVLIGLFVFLAGCKGNDEQAATNASNSNSNSTGEKVLKVGLTGTPGNFDPHFASSHVDYEIAQPIFNGLLRFKPGTASFETIEGDLAESWEVSEDGLVWTFKLREGVQWHKGYGELTSADVKYSLERIVDPEVGSNQAYQIRFLDKIETPDDYTVEIHLTKPYPGLPIALTVDSIASGAIVKKEAIESDGDMEDKLVGTGPFELESYVPGERAVLVKNPDYFRGEPKLDKIEMIVMRDLTAREVALINGDIHMTRGELDKVWIDRMKQNEDLVFSSTGTPNVGLFHMNMTVEPLDDIRVRKAIAHAIDYEGLRQSMYSDDFSHQLTSVLANDVYGKAEIGVVEYNPELSKKLLAEAGYPDGLTLPTVTTPNLNSYITPNNYIQEQLRQVGIELPMEQVDTPTWLQDMFKNENALAYVVAVQREYGTLNLLKWWHSDGLSNYTLYNESDDLIDAITTEMDDAKYLELSKQAQQEIFDAYVSIPMFAIDQINVWRKEVDLGYELEGTGVYAAPKYETTDLVE